MSIDVFWRLPPNGDGRSHRTAEWTRGDYQGAGRSPAAFARIGGDDRFNYYDHLAQIARGAEIAGFDGVFIPQTDEGEEPLIVAGGLAREARRIRLAPQLPVHFLSAVYAAKIATSFQRLTGGRLVLSLAFQDPGAGAWHGHDWTVAEQAARADEFLTVFKGVWSAGPFTYEGRYYEVLDGGFTGPLAGQPLPQILLSGDAEEILALSARHGDVHLFDPTSPEDFRTRADRLQSLAAEQGRTLRFGLQAEVIARHGEAEAAADGADRWPQGAPDAGLIGAFDAVARRLDAYVEAGAGTLVLGAHPHLEEGYRIAQHLLPRLAARAVDQRKIA
jgi:alkanesulfonate monooxygenase